MRLTLFYASLLRNKLLNIQYLKEKHVNVNGNFKKKTEEVSFPLGETDQSHLMNTGAPNESILQNHLNIALLNVS